MPAIKWGRKKEPAARSAYKELIEASHEDTKFHECGLFISLETSFVGATPDGLLSCSCCGEALYELKCSYAAAGLPFEKTLELHLFCLESSAGSIHLRKSSKYMHQVQLQMYCTQQNYAHLVIWTPAWIRAERVNYDALS